jgi:hypothetical protein
MAAPLTKRQTTGHRDSIETAKLLKAVQAHVLDGSEMAQSQLQGAEMLLKRTMPSLQSIEQTTEHSGTVKIAVSLGD